MKTIRNTSSGIAVGLAILFTVIGGQKSFSQGVGISEIGIIPDPSSILELRSSLRGLLAPRMTTGQRDAIASPATGLIIYNTTTNAFNYFNGTVWIDLLNTGSGVTAVNGTLNRISVGGTPTVPVIDIDANYAGQASINTLGTIISGTWNGTRIAIANGGTGQITQQTAINALAGAVTSGQYLRGNGTNIILSVIQAGDVPTLNQNTTGSAGSAAKWTTARYLAGNSVDGSADVPFANKFIVQGTSDAGLSGAQFLGFLGTGLVKNTTTTGVLSIAAAGTDYMVPNGAITAATKTKITYDSRGLVTAGADATADDISPTATRTYVTPAQLTVINNTSNTNSGDVTLTAIGSSSSPNANGASLAGQVLTLQPANGSFGGVLTAGAQTIAGIKTFLSDLIIDPTGSNTGAPRNIGITTWVANNAVRFMLGNAWNSLQNAYSFRMQLTAYNGIDIAGNRESQTPLGWVPGALSDASLNVVGTTATAPVLTVTSAAGQSGYMQEWRNSAGTALASITSAGAISASNLSNTNTGDQTITLTGNVTGSGTGSFATTIANNAVTYGKMQAVSTTSRLLGSSSAATNIQEISLGSGLSLVGTVLSSAGSGGTVTNFSAGDLTPLFTTTEATTTTTPALSFSFTNAGTYTIFGNNTGVAAAPAYFTPVLASSLFQNQGAVTSVLHGNAGGTPSWGQIVNADITNSTINLTTKVTGTLPIANGGTNSSTSLSGSSIMISNGSAIIQGAAGTTNTVLHGNAGAAPTFGAVNLVNEITGTLPVGNGGTGATTLADHGVLIGSGTGMISATAVGIDGQVLQSAGPGFDPTYSTATYPSTAGTAGNILRSNGTNFISTPINQAQATPNNPVGTSNLTGVMMGLNQAFTPARSGMILIIISGDIGNSLANDGGQVQIRYGTGSIPTNGAALTGSTAGGLVKLLSVGATAGRRYPFTANAIVTSLTPGNLIWIDVGLAAITGGTALIYDLSISVIEL